MPEDFESLYRIIFFSVAVALVLLEQVRTLRRQPVHVTRRWTSNLGLFLIGSVVSAIVLPIGIYAFALQQPPGPLSRPEIPFAAQLALTFLLLDFGRYWEHRLFHRIPLLWRMHLVHHSDTEVDVTTSERHHPLEFLLGTATMLALIAALGLPAPAVGVYLLVATVITLASHANLRLRAGLDRQLRRFVVTPSMHAVHHSDLQPETDSNYGAVLTLWDRIFGTFVNPERARIPHFGLGYFHLPRDTGLARVLLQPFLYRRGLAYPERTATGAIELPSGAMTRRCKDALLVACAGGAMVCVAMWPVVLDLTISWRKESYQYAWLVLPMVVYLLAWHGGPIGLPSEPQPDFTGLPVAIVAAACWTAAALMNIDVGRQFALVLALQAVAMSALGWRSYWQLFPVLALLFMLIPSGDLLLPPLRALTLKSIEVFAVVANLPHSVDGYAVFIGTHRYIVIDECAGLSFVTMATFVGYCLGLLLYRSIVKVAALALFGAFLGIAANVLRVNSIVLVDWFRGSQMDLAAHGPLQWLALLLALGVLLYVVSRLRADAISGPPVAVPQECRRAASASAGPSQGRGAPLGGRRAQRVRGALIRHSPPWGGTARSADREGSYKRRTPMRGYAPVIAVLSVLLLAHVAIGILANELRPSRAGQAGKFPQDLSGWELANPTAAWSGDPQGGTESISLSYRRGDRDLRVVVVESLSADAKLPDTNLALREQGVWHQRQVRKETACSDSACLALLHSTWQREKSRQLRHVYHAYSLGDFTTDSRLALRARHGWQRLTGGRDSPRVIAMDFGESVPDSAELAAAFRRVQSAAKG